VVLAQAGLISLLLHERSRRHFAEVQSRQRMSELARINRFSTAGELTASIAHEINQPLASIRMNAETMELIVNSASPKIEEIREITADIRRDEERATEVILRVRSLLRKAPFELRNVDFNGIVSETLEFISALALSRQVKLHGALYPGPLAVAADQIQLQQVILNLIVNAMDAMADIPAADRHITVSTGRKDDFVEASISDSGPGIPVDKLTDMFEPFFTTKEHGMGMGLSIARTIVEAHDGQLLAENQIKGGALFTIRLPALKALEPC
jgi:C4-dicarboxylate-specific signal transduction histidine kinase